MEFKLNKYSIYDKFEFIILVICLAILPLPPFLGYIWISTLLVLPMLAFKYLLIESNEILNIDKFLVKILLIIFTAFVSVFIIDSLDSYLVEIKKLLGVIVLMIIIFFSVKRNKNNIFLFYTVFILKFIILLIYTYNSGILNNYSANEIRLQSGYEIGVNANVYGYFGFISLFSIAFLLFRSGKFYLFILLYICFALTLYVNIIAASRAGLIFAILAFLAIYFGVTFKKFNVSLVKLILFSFLNYYKKIKFHIL